MPRGDKTGPRGMGAMSGGRMGFCAENTTSEFANQTSNHRRDDGFGFRQRFRGRNTQSGGGFGFRRVRGLFPSEPVNKKSILGEQIESLKNQLEELENQFKNLK